MRSGTRNNEDLRTLVVHRLSDTTKSVARIGLRTGLVSIFCEACEEWERIGPTFPLEWTCRGCSRKYAMEFAVMEELNAD